MNFLLKAQTCSVCRMTKKTLSITSFYLNGFESSVRVRSMYSCVVVAYLFTVSCCVFLLWRLALRIKLFCLLAVMLFSSLRKYRKKSPALHTTMYTRSRSHEHESSIHHLHTSDSSGEPSEENDKKKKQSQHTYNYSTCVCACIKGRQILDKPTQVTIFVWYIFRLQRSKVCEMWKRLFGITISVNARTQATNLFVGLLSYSCIHKIRRNTTITGKTKENDFVCIYMILVCVYGSTSANEQVRKERKSVSRAEFSQCVRTEHTIEWTRIAARERKWSSTCTRRS